MPHDLCTYDCTVCESGANATRPTATHIDITTPAATATTPIATPTAVITPFLRRHSTPPPPHQPQLQPDLRFQSISRTLRDHRRRRRLHTGNLITPLVHTIDPTPIAHLADHLMRAAHSHPPRTPEDRLDHATHCYPPTTHPDITTHLRLQPHSTATDNGYLACPGCSLFLTFHLSRVLYA